MSNDLTQCQMPLVIHSSQRTNTYSDTSTINPSYRNAIKLHDRVQNRLSPILKNIREILNENEWRANIYLILIMLAFIPLFANELDIICNHYNENTPLSWVSFANLICCAVLLFGVGTFFIVNYVCSSNTSHQTKYNVRVMFVVCLIIAFLILLLTVITVAEAGNYDTQYIGTNSLRFCIIFSAFIDFLYCFNQRRRQNYIKVRLFLFSFGLLISSACNTLTFAVNHTTYMQKSFGVASFYICIVGYLFVMLTALFSWMYACCKHQTFKTYSRLFTPMLLFGAILVVSKMYGSYLYIIMCIIVAVDIQVIKES
eukprot:356024_1